MIATAAIAPITSSPEPSANSPPISLRLSAPRLLLSDVVSAIVVLSLGAVPQSPNMAPRGEAITLALDGKEVRFSSPNRVVFPARGHTKLDPCNYYLAVADAC